LYNYRIAIGKQVRGTLISVYDTPASTSLAPSIFSFTPNMTALFESLITSSPVFLFRFNQRQNQLCFDAHIFNIKL
jgi:hypothetical protein